MLLLHHQAMTPLLVYCVGTFFGTETWCLPTGIVLLVVVAGVLTASYGELQGHHAKLVEKMPQIPACCKACLISAVAEPLCSNCQFTDCNLYVLLGATHSICIGALDLLY